MKIGLRFGIISSLPGGIFSMKIDRKEMRSSIYDYVKVHYWALFRPLLIIFVITNTVTLAFWWFLDRNNITNLTYVSNFISYFLLIYGSGIYTVALVDCLRAEQTMNVKRVVSVIQTHNSRLFLLSLMMTFLLIILTIIGAMVHLVVENLIYAFMMLAYAFAFPISVDQPSLKNIEVISASFKQTTGLRWDMFLLETKPMLIVLIPLTFAIIFADPFIWLTSNNLSNGIIVFGIFIACAIILTLYVMPKVFSVFGFVYQSITPQRAEIIQ
jgi:hypothetical protein